MDEGILRIGGVSCKDVGLGVKEYPSIPLLSENYKEDEVEGRNGNLITMLGTYPNREITFKLSKLSKELDLNFDDIYNWLENRANNLLEFNLINRCFHILNIKYGNFEQEFKIFGSMEITFVVEPFMYDVIETSVSVSTSGTKIYCSGTMGAEPIMVITGSGDVTITIGNETFSIDNISTKCTVDSAKRCTYNSDNTTKDYEVNGNYPTLKFGYNTISWTGTVSNILFKYINRYR